MNRTAVSVVVMVYKNFDELENTVKSVINQKYSNIELIVSDDGSPNFKEKYFDKIRELCKGTFEHLVLIHNEINQGTVKHYNNIIKNAKGEIICPLSCGDKFINENVVEKIAKTFEENNCMVLTSQRMENCENKDGKILPKKNELDYLMNPQKSLSCMISYGNFIGGATTYFRKSIFDQFGYFDENYTLLEDYPYFLKLLANNVRFYCLYEPTILYDMTGVSTGVMNPLLKNDCILLFQSLLANNKLKLTYLNKRFLKYRINKLSQKYNIVLLHVLFLDVVIVYFMHEYLNITF